MPKPLLALCLALATLTACTGEPLSRTGATTDPVTLTAVWGQGPEAMGGDVHSHLIAGTDDAAVRVVEDGPQIVGDTSAELHAVESLRAGDADITVVRAGVLQMLGADSLAPLGAPFVVTNNDQATAIAEDDELSEQLLSSLDDLGLVGLGLVPGGLRHPFAYGSQPLLGAEDYRDQVINVREDAGVLAILDQLGARADHSVDSERNRAAGTRLRGIEVSLQQLGAVTLPAVQSANVTLYAKFDVGIVRQETWNGMSAAQRRGPPGRLPSGGDRRHGDSDNRGRGSGGVVRDRLGSERARHGHELASLRRALDPITDRLAENPDAARVLDRMRELGIGTTDPSPSACRSKPPESTSEFYVTPKGNQNVLDGLWRIEVDQQDLLDAGISPQDALANAGVWEFRIEDGYHTTLSPTDARATASSPSTATR